MLKAGISQLFRTSVQYTMYTLVPACQLGLDKRAQLPEINELLSSHIIRQT